jgi:phage shock protein A
MKQSVKESVPVDFEINRARKMITDLAPEIRHNMHLIAKEEVEIERLEKQVSSLDDRLAKGRKDVLQLKDDIESGKEYFYYAGHRYSVGEVRNDLANRFERYKTNEATVTNLQKVLLARRRSLEAARRKLEGMLAAKRTLVVDVENLEARQKMVEVAQTASDFNFDDSHLARTKGLLTDIRTRIEVAEKMLDVETNFRDEIPLDEPGVENISAEVAEYFNGDHPGVETLAESL